MEETNLTMEDEEFLEDIDSLTEEQKNAVLAYIKNRETATFERGAQAEKEKILNWLKDWAENALAYKPTLLIVIKELDREE